MEQGLQILKYVFIHQDLFLADTSMNRISATSVAISLVQAKRMRDSEIQMWRHEAKRLKDSNTALVHILKQSYLARAEKTALQDASIDPRDILLKGMLLKISTDQPDDGTPIINLDYNHLTEISIAESERLLSHCRAHSINKDSKSTLQNRAKALADLLLGLQTLDMFLGHVRSVHNTSSKDTQVRPVSVSFLLDDQLAALLRFIRGPLMELTPGSDLAQDYRKMCVYMLAAMMMNNTHISGNRQVKEIKTSAVKDAVGDTIFWLLSLAMGEFRSAMPPKRAIPQAGIEFLRSVLLEAPLIGCVIFEALSVCLGQAVTTILNCCSERIGIECKQEEATKTFTQSTVLFDLMVSAYILDIDSLFTGIYFILEALHTSSSLYTASIFITVHFVPQDESL